MGGKNSMKFSHVLIHSNCVFTNLSSWNSLWCISPVFEGLYINHAWQAARLSCWRQRSVPTGVKHCAGNNACIQSSSPHSAFLITYHWRTYVQMHHISFFWMRWIFILYYVYSSHFLHFIILTKWAQSVLQRRKYPAKQRNYSLLLCPDMGTVDLAEESLADF